MSAGGSYINNLASANRVFNHRLHDRLGEPGYTEALHNGEASVSSLWMRHVGGHERSTLDNGQFTRSNRYVMQMGGDLAQWSSNNQDRWHLGIMGGYANVRSNTHSYHSTNGSDGRVSGYSAGLYGTWFQNGTANTGPYIDIWLLYNWFNSSVTSNHNDRDDYHSDGLTASIEGGHTFKVAEFTGSKGTLNSWYIQPQVQITWMGVDDESHSRHDDVHIETQGDDNIQTRLGVRTYINSHHQMDEGLHREFQPYLEVNWIHNTETYGVSSPGYNLTRNDANNLAEVRAGLEAKLNDNLSLWGNAGVQFVGPRKYNDLQGMLGVKASF
ncbi:autotransporter [Trabulsiella odontotermitis]|uniref:Autotransporter n=1 Tax=Trabulsiella odontotermitis TaxID=379893 RepID=A0A0L0H357_9ENTR|nr:autotransporter [Trabulsiella odontotermitis]